MARPELDENLHWLKHTKTEAGRSEKRGHASAQDLDAGRPKFPHGCTKRQRQLFKEGCRLLADRRVLTPGDKDALWLRAVLIERLELCYAKEKETGGPIVKEERVSNGVPYEITKQNPWTTLAQATEKSLAAILDRTGLTPAFRSRVKPAKQELPAEDDLDAIMQRPEPTAPVAFRVAAPAESTAGIDTSFDA